MSRFSQTAVPASTEARLAAHLAGALSMHAQALPHAISERLRFSRTQALARATQLRAETASGTTLVAQQGVGILMLFAPWGQRVASLLPVVALVFGMMMIDKWAARENMLVAVDIDARLLSDDLPPAAYADPGFGEFLRSPPAP